MPDENEIATATNLAVTLAWAAGAMTAAFALGVVLTWILGRLGRRSAMLCDVAHLTRMPVRFTLMVIAATISVQRTSDPADTWRRLVDHSLVILLILGVTWLLTGFVRVAERRMIARFGVGDLLTAAAGGAGSGPRSRSCAGSPLRSSSSSAVPRS